MLRMTSGTKISAHTEVVTLYFHHPSSETYVKLDRHKAEKYNFIFFLTLLNIKEEFLQTWNHLACLKAARASKHFCLSSTSGGSLVACA